MSKIIVAGRRTGKTLRCITESAATGKHILVMYDTQKQYILDTAKSLQLVVPEPITLQEWRNGKGTDFRRDGVIVDEAKGILQNMLGSEIHLMTITEEDEGNE